MPDIGYGALGLRIYFNVERYSGVGFRFWKGVIKFI